MSIGRPRTTLSRKQITQLETLAGYGLTQAQIADVLGISDRTLRRRIGEDSRLLAVYKKGRAAALARVAGTLYEMAIGRKSAASTIFFLKTQAGWTEQQNVRPSVEDSALKESDLDTRPIASITLDSARAAMKALLDGGRRRAGLPPLPADFDPLGAQSES